MIELVPALADGFKSNRAPLRNECVRILLDIGSPGQKQLLAFGRAALPALGTALRANDSAVRAKALDTLVWMKELGRHELRKALAIRDKHLLLEYCTRMLAHDNGTYETWLEMGVEALPALTAVLEDTNTDDTTAGRAVRTLGFLRTTEAVPVLIRVLASREQHNARADAEAGEIAARQAGEEARVRKAEALEAANPRPPRTLDDAMRRNLPPDPGAEARKKREKEQRARLRPSPSDTRRWVWARVRANAAEALGKLGDPRAVPALTAALTDHDTVSTAAQKALENVRR